MASEKRKTPSEILAELRNKPGSAELVREHEERCRPAIEAYTRNAAPLLDALARAGFVVKSVGELLKLNLDYQPVIPLLLEWLPRITYRPLQDDVIRALSVPWARPTAAPILIREFVRSDAPPLGIRWTIANALSVVADDTVFNDIVALVKDTRYGRDREMLAQALANMRNPRAVDVLIGLIDDPDVYGPAIVALGKLRAKKARAAIEPFLEHSKAWVRAEARKALARIDKVPRKKNERRRN